MSEAKYSESKQCAGGKFVFIKIYYIISEIGTLYCFSGRRKILTGKMLTQTLKCFCVTSGDLQTYQSFIYRNPNMTFVACRNFHSSGFRHEWKFLSALPDTAVSRPGRFTHESSPSLWVCRSARRQEDVVRSAGLSAIPHDGNDAGRELSCRWRLFALLSL